MPIIDGTGSLAGIRISGNQQHIIGGWAEYPSAYTWWSSVYAVVIDASVNDVTLVGFHASQTSNKIQINTPRGSRCLIYCPGVSAGAIDFSSTNTIGTSNLQVASAGFFNTHAANWQFSAGGQNNLQATYSHAPGGYGGRDWNRTGSRVQSNDVFTSGGNPVYGSAQSREAIFRVATTDATLTDLTTTGVAASTTNIITIPIDSTTSWRGSAAIDLVVIARDSAGNSARWTIKALVKRVSSTITIVNSSGTGTPEMSDAALSTCTVVLTKSDSLLGVYAQVTGIAATNINWVGGPPGALDVLR
jgi:hypothetical protein